MIITKEKHSFLKRVVRLCLVMMVLLTLTVVVIAIIQKENIEAGTLGVLMGGWCGELLLSLLKRKFETEDKTENKNDESLEDDEQ